jgi:hypothetical protein
MGMEQDGSPPLLCKTCILKRIFGFRMIAGQEENKDENTACK